MVNCRISGTSWWRCGLNLIHINLDIHYVSVTSSSWISWFFLIIHYYFSDQISDLLQVGQTQVQWMWDFFYFTIYVTLKWDPNSWNKLDFEDNLNHKNLSPTIYWVWNMSYNIHFRIILHPIHRRTRHEQYLDVK